RGPLAAIAEYGIRFRVNEESGSQVIWVQTEEDAEKVVQALARWQALKEEGVIADPAPGSNSLGSYFPLTRILRDIGNAFLLAPVTMLCLLAALVVALVSSLGSHLQPVAGLFSPAG